MTNLHYMPQICPFCIADSSIMKKGIINSRGRDDALDLSTRFYVSCENNHVFYSKPVSICVND